MLTDPKIVLSLNRTTYNRVVAEAKASGVSPADIVRAMVDDALEERPDPDTLVELDKRGKL